MDLNRIFMPEQIEVHRDLPGILKEYTKAVIRGNLTNEKEIIAFSLNYFTAKCELSKVQSTHQ
ncbi:unnamed protein product [Laminaria digitata]